MGKYIYNQSSFSSGEISPNSRGRVVNREYFNAASRMENFFPMIQGGVKKRPGTIFKRDITNTDFGLDSAGGSSIIPFVFSREESYFLIIKPNGKSPVSSNPFIEIYRNDEACTQMTINLFGYLTVIPADTDPAQFVYAQAGDVLFITHTSGTIPPIIVEREGTTDFNVIEFGQSLVSSFRTGEDVDFILKFPYRAPNVNGNIRLTPSAVSGAITLSATNSGGAPINFFQPGMKNTLFRIEHSGTEGVALVTSTIVAATNIVNATVLKNFGATTATDNWRESAFGTTYRGWPMTVAFHDQRLCWGGTPTQPNTIWFSRTGNIFHLMGARLEQDAGSATDVSGLNYFGDLSDSDPFSVILSSTDFDRIAWMSGGQVLQAGTLGAEFSIGSGNNGFGISTVQVQKHTSFGGKPGRVLRVGNTVLFISTNGRTLRIFKYNEANGSYVAHNASILADHLYKWGELSTTDLYSTITETKPFEFIDIAYCKSRDAVFLLTSKHDLVCLTFDPLTDSLAWSKHKLGGTNVNIWGITSIPSLVPDTENIYMFVEREINGAAEYYIESIRDDFDGSTLSPLDNDEYFVDAITNEKGSQAYPLYLDSAKIIVSAATASLSGLSHLEGETVTVLMNGAKLANTYVVSSGAISFGSTLGEAANVFIVGLPYESHLETIDLEAGGEFGNSPGVALQKVDRVVIKTYKTYDLKVGTTTSNYQHSIDFGSDISSQVIASRVDIMATPEILQRIKFSSTNPYPCTILNITLRGVASD